MAPPHPYFGKTMSFKNTTDLSPEKTGNLPNRYLHIGNINFIVESFLNFLM